MSMDEKQADATIEATSTESQTTEPTAVQAEATSVTEAAPQPAAEAATEQAAEAVTEQPRPRRRGFAAMDRDRVKEIASKGGRAAHAAGTAHQFSADEARVAGKKGGMAPHVRRGGVRRRPVATEASPPASQQGTTDGR